MLVTISFASPSALLQGIPQGYCEKVSLFFQLYKVFLCAFYKAKLIQIPLKLLHFPSFYHIF